MAAGAKTIQTLRHAMTLAQDATIKLLRHEGLNEDNLLSMQLSIIPQTELIEMSTQDQGAQVGNKNTKGNVSGLNWTVNPTCNNCN